jgi:hypothetical protein
LALTADIVDQFNSADDWTKGKTPKAILDNHNKKSHATADDEQFTMLQEAFDGISRLTLATKRLGAELVANLGGARAQDTIALKS